MRKAERIGLLFVVLSAYPLFLMGREVLAQRNAHSLYALRRVPTSAPGFFDDSLSAEIGSRHVELHDDLFGVAAKREDLATGRVSIVIDGREDSYPSEIVIRPFFKDQNRYHSWVKLIRLIDRRNNKAWLAVVQRISRTPAGGHEDWEFAKSQLRYRIVRISGDGSVSEEVFAFDDRASPPYRAMLAQFVTPYGIGFHSEVLQAWPTIPFPIIYPCVTAIVGCCLLAIGVISRLRRPKGALVQS